MGPKPATTQVISGAYSIKHADRQNAPTRSSLGRLWGGGLAAWGQTASPTGPPMHRSALGPSQIVSLRQMAGGIIAHHREPTRAQTPDIPFWVPPPAYSLCILVGSLRWATMLIRFQPTDPCGSIGWRPRPGRSADGKLLRSRPINWRRLRPGLSRWDAEQREMETSSTGT